MAVISPIPPTSASNLQPSTPIDNSMDKNTPAATPTDQQDSKSTTASPYVMPAPPSVEPPSSQLMDQTKVKSESGTGHCSGNNSSGSSSSSSSSTNSLSATVTGNSVGQGCTMVSVPTASTLSSTVNAELKNILSLMKRPMLGSRDYENLVDDDYMPQQLLYDYSTWEAW